MTVRCRPAVLPLAGSCPLHPEGGEPMLRALIFDGDGTLVDSVDLHAKAWQETFRHFGREIPFHEVRRQIGKGGDQLMPVFFTHEELDRFGQEMEQWRSELFKRV